MRSVLYMVKSEVPQNTHMARFHGNWPCKSEALETPKLEGGKRQLPAPRKYRVPKGTVETKGRTEKESKAAHPRNLLIHTSPGPVFPHLL